MEILKAEFSELTYLSGLRSWKKSCCIFFPVFVFGKYLAIEALLHFKSVLSVELLATIEVKCRVSFHFVFFMPNTPIMLSRYQ